MCVFVSEPASRIRPALLVGFPKGVFARRAGSGAMATNIHSGSLFRYSAVRMFMHIILCCDGLWHHAQLSAGQIVRFGSFNALTAASLDRVTEISELCHNIDVLGVQSTGIRAMSGPIMSCMHTCNHMHIVFGRNVKSRNSSLGCSLLLGRRLFCLASIVYYSVPPLLVMGRGGLVRIVRGLFDVAVIVLYFPMKVREMSTNIKEYAQYRSHVTALVSWLRRELALLPSRCMPFILMDNNDGFGLQKCGSDWTHIQDSIVGPHFPAREYYVSTQLRQVFSQNCMTVLNTQSESSARPTFFGQGYTSRPDHVVALTNVQSSIRKVGPLMRLSRQLQHITTRSRRDHMLLYFEYTVQHALVEIDSNPVMCWNHDALMQCIIGRDPVRRRDFVQRVEVACGDLAEPFKVAMDADPTPDTPWRKFNSVVHDVGLRPAPPLWACGSSECLKCMKMQWKSMKSAPERTSRTSHVRGGHDDP